MFPKTVLLLFMSADLITNLRSFFDDSGINYFEYILVYFCEVRGNINFINRNVRRVERVQIKLIDLRGGKLENLSMDRSSLSDFKNAYTNDRLGALLECKPISNRAIRIRLTLSYSSSAPINMHWRLPVFPTALS